MKVTNVQAKTRPIVIHAPGFTSSKILHSSLAPYYKKNPLWVAIQSCYRKTRPKKIKPEDMNDLTIITWNSSCEKGILEECLDRMAVPYLILGRGIEKWRNILKIRLSYDALGGIKTKYVMGLDSYDALLLENPREVVKRFESFSCEMLFNANIRFYPRCHYFEAAGERFITRDWEDFQSGISDGYWRYLNSGAWIGRTLFCRRFLADCSSRNVEELINKGSLPRQKGAKYQKVLDSDQTVFNWAFKDYFPQVQLDYDCKIFLNLSCLPDSDRHIRLYRKFYEIPLSLSKSLYLRRLSVEAKPIKKKVRRSLNKLLNKKIYPLAPVFKLSKILKEKFIWYKRFVALIKGKNIKTGLK